MSASVGGFGWSGGSLGVTVGGVLGVPGGSVGGGADGVLVAGGIEGFRRSATPGVGSTADGSAGSEAAVDGCPSTGPLVAGGCPGCPFSSGGALESGGGDGVGVAS